MKATELLKNQHQQVDALFEQIEGSEGREARPLIQELATALVAHSMIEREILYPAFEEALSARAELREAHEEHALVEYELQKLLRTDPGDESFLARVSVLKNLVQHHVREEEDNLLPRADREMDEDRLEELGEQMQMRFEEIQSEDVEALLAASVRRSTLRTRARRPAKKAAARRGAAQQPARSRKRAAAPRAKPARSTGKGGRTTERKAGAQQREGSRGGSARGGTSSRGGSKATRGGKSTRGGNGRKGGRSSSTSSR